MVGNNINSYNSADQLQDYHQLEIELHRDLMNCCRKYLNRVGIISIVGILDIVKQETIELEKATKKI